MPAKAEAKTRENAQRTPAAGVARRPARPRFTLPTGRCELRLSGSGGQGLILAATVLADAAVVTGKQVVQIQSYGPEARGGASRAEVIISSEEIDYPELEAPHVTLCLSQESFASFAGATREGGLVLYDSDLVKPADVPHVDLAGAPFTAIAKESAGTSQAANVVALGALQAITGVVTREALVEALGRRLPARLLEANGRALDAGAAAL